MKDIALSLVTLVKGFISKGHQRSVKAKKNIIVSFFLKGISIAISLIFVPLTINYINPSRYGIWLTLSAIVGWFSFFDIGLSHGLKNKFAEAKAKGDDSLAQTYVSTAYGILAIVFCSIWIVFLVVNHFLNWSRILNIPESLQNDVSILAIIVFTYFCLQFVLKIISSVLIADQQPSKVSLIDVLGQLLSLAFIFVLIKTTQGSLVKLGIALCASPLVVLIGANFFLFSGPYKKYRPLISKIDFSYGKKLLNLGLVFFIIQVAAILQFETANIIIARNFGTVEVTSYNIAYKYFSMLQMVFAIFLLPFWAASTEAYLKKDIQWIKNSIKRYNQLNLVLFVAGLLMLLCSDTVYRLWLGKGKVHIDFLLSLWSFIFFSASIFGEKYVFFLNGISALRIQFLASLISPVLYAIIAIVLIKYYHLGAYSLFIACVIANFNKYLLAPLQYYQIIHKNKKGIWIKS
jgi:O-antigen/teichoic acid export membrane protein